MIVDSYKGANMDISQTCKNISETLLVRIDSKKIYENLEFDDDQKHHRASIQKKLHEMHDHITRTMRRTYEVFRVDGPDVQQHWLRYTEKMDRMVEEAFRLNVKWSLQELSRAINGDGKSAPNPLFKVKVVLEGDKVEFSPTLKQLATIVSNISGYLTATISEIKRLPDLLTRTKSSKGVSACLSVTSTDFSFFFCVSLCTTILLFDLQGFDLNVTLIIDSYYLLVQTPLISHM